MINRVIRFSHAILMSSPSEISFIPLLRMLDLGLSFTWTNNHQVLARICICLDHVFTNPRWFQFFDRCIVTHLSCTCYDNCFLFINVNGSSTRRRCFFFVSNFLDRK